MAVVKSDGYGHGAIPAATAALSAGAGWLGVGHVSEGVALRQAGITVPVLSLLAAPDAPHADAITHGIDLSVGSDGQLRQISAAAAATGRPARVHLKADTGMSRGGASPRDWPGLVAAALAEQAAGRCEIVGIWSHLACADIPGHESVDAQLDRFHTALAVALRAGARPTVRHLANTAAVLTRPDTWFDLVRPGGGVTGLATLPGGPPDWLRPAMTVRARLVQVKQVPAGTGVSYGHRYLTSARTTLGVVPLGYHEGVPRSGANTAQVMVRGSRVTISGTVCMNQFVVDVGDLPVEEGDEVVLFGPGDHGEPTAQGWADALGTISYDIVTRFTAKIPRSYSGVTPADTAAARTAGAQARVLAGSPVAAGLGASAGTRDAARTPDPTGTGPQEV